MPNILDIYGDKSLKGLVSIMREHPELYDKIKDVNVDYDEKETLPESAFAYPEERALPINNAQMALLSSLYRNSQPEMELPPYVDENLKKAEYLYDLPVIEKKAKQIEKKAEIQDSDYLIPSLKKFPVRNKKEADCIQRIIVKNAHVMGYDHLAEASLNLVNKYAEYKTPVNEIDPVIYKYAGMTLSNRDMLDASIQRRKDFVDEKFQSSYTKLSEVVEKMDFNRDNLLKIASTIEHIDKEAGLRRLYDKHLLNPIESVFNTTRVFGVKTAAADEFTYDLANSVTPEQIQNLLGPEVLTESMDQDQLNKEKLMQVINSLPNEMRSDFISRIS